MAISFLASLVVLLASATAAVSDPAAAAPRLLGLSPTAGPREGGNLLTIRGQHLAHVTSVSFGGVTTRHITQQTDDRLLVKVPAHHAGLIHVHLHAGSATSGSPARNPYRFIKGPAAFGATPYAEIDPLRGQLGSPSCPGCGGSPACTVHDFCAVGEEGSHGRWMITFSGEEEARVQKIHAPGLDRVGGGLACGTPTFCIAGGPDEALVWDGASWADPVALPGHARISRSNDLACAQGSTLCAFVGPGGGPTLVHDAAGWRVLPLPAHFFPYNFACAGQDFCIAVGDDPSGLGTAYFNGHAWRMGPDPGDDNERAGGVACTSPSYCLATNDDASDAHEWDGHTWSAVAAPPVNTGPGPLTCRARRHCFLDNYSSDNPDGRILAFDDGSWTEVLPPGGTAFDQLVCSKGGACWSTYGPAQVIRYQQGTWDSRYITRDQRQLSDVSCPSATWCMAVADGGNAMQYSDGAWSAPTRVDEHRQLTAISCTADHTCVAVDSGLGRGLNALDPDGHAAVFADGQWAEPTVIDPGVGLRDVSCPATGHCVAVDSGGRALVYADGTWSAPDPISNSVRALSCASPTECYAVGDAVYRFEGTTWHQVSGSTDHYFDIDCVDPDYCALVGQRGSSVLHHGTFSVPVLPRGGLALLRGSIACASRAACLAYEGIVIRYVDDEPISDDRDVTIDNASVRRLGYAGRESKSDCVLGPVCVQVYYAYATRFTATRS